MTLYEYIRYLTVNCIRGAHLTTLTILGLQLLSMASNACIVLPVSTMSFFQHRKAEVIRDRGQQKAKNK